METSGFISFCNNSTEKECLHKNLFGHRYLIDHIIDSEILSSFGFLYNYQKDELIGVFKAVSTFQKNIEPNAFSGKYPFQIRVFPDGALHRRGNAITFFKEIGIRVSRTRYNHHLPSSIITSSQVDQLRYWLGGRPEFRMEGAINNLISFLSDPELAKPLEKLRTMIPYTLFPIQIADTCLIFLRDNVIKKEFVDSIDNLGVLRRTMKNLLLTNKITTQQQFDNLCTTHKLNYDERQRKYLPLIYIIISRIESV